MMKTRRSFTDDFKRDEGRPVDRTLVAQRPVEH